MAKPLLKIELPFSQSISNLLSDLRVSLLWIFPSVILYSVLVLIASLANYWVGFTEDYAILIRSFYQNSQLIFSYLLTVAITITTAIRWKLSRPANVMLSLFYLGVYQFLASNYSTGAALQYLIAIITPLYTLPILAKLSQIKIFSQRYSSQTSTALSDSLNLILPACLIMLIVILVDKSILIIVDKLPNLAITLTDLQNDPYWYGSLFAGISAISHFLGIHSIYTLAFLHEPLTTALTENIQAHELGGLASNALNITSAPVFGLLGGAGSTMGLALAILIFAKDKSLKTVAWISLPMGFFNINEILVFGIPILLNPILFIPFLFAPIISLCLAVFLIEIGFVAPSVVSVPFVSPMFINAYIATAGDLNAVLVQLICLVISTLLYLPFIRKLQDVYSGKKIYFPKFDTFYSRKREEALVLRDDIINKNIAQQRNKRKLEQELSNISHAEFSLEYQPKVSVIDSKIIGAEALIRAKEGNKRLFPLAFLPWLKEGGLIQDMDLWVFHQVVTDMKQLKEHGINIRISINITAETLLNDEYGDKILRLLGESGLSEQIDLEVTEQSLLEDEQKITALFEQFHDLGISIHIDDFGTGYSSLSYLPRFNIDAIKIDRSFVVATETEKGQHLFQSIFDIAAGQHLGVIVEGVETREQLALIPKQKNISVQGWYYSRSLEYNDFIDYLNDFDPSKVIR